MTRYVVLDAKGDYTSSDEDCEYTDEYRPKLARQVIRVTIDEYEQERWDEVIEQAVRSHGRGAVLYVDEVTLINPSPVRLRPPLGRAIRTGRSLGLGVWCGSQRPKDIPSAVFTESEHFWLFQLQWEADRRKVQSFTRDDIGRAIGRLRGHECVYYSVRDNRWWLSRLRLGT